LPKQTESTRSEIKIKPSDPWLMKTTQTIRNSQRFKQMVIGRIEFPRRQEAPTLVCIETAHLPNKGVLAGIALSCILPPADRTGEPSMTSHASGASQLTNSCRRSLVHVMVVNFSREEIVLLKATVIGVDEEISTCVVRK
jgi:hypothetical protein